MKGGKFENTLIHTIVSLVASCVNGSAMKYSSSALWWRHMHVMWSQITGHSTVGLQAYVDPHQRNITVCVTGPLWREFTGDPVTWKKLPFDDVIMVRRYIHLWFILCREGMWGHDQLVWHLQGRKWIANSTRDLACGIRVVGYARLQFTSQYSCGRRCIVLPRWRKRVEY